MLAVLGLISAIPLMCAAQGDAAVKAGNEIKKTTGVVKHLENGDAACYLTLADEQGREFRELGNFDLCFQKPSIVGKRVSLEYKVESVLADECQGDPTCKKSKKLAVVAKARIVDAAAAPSASAGAGASTSAGQASFCTPQEEVVFACRSGVKLVSVCASKGASRTRGSVQYRFGKADSHDPLEMTLPVDQPLAATAASGESVSFSGGGGAWLRFRKAPFAYVVYSGIGKWGPKGETMEKQGIVVERGGKSIARLKCSGKLTSILGPDWLEKVGIRSNGEEFDFPE